MEKLQGFRRGKNSRQLTAVAAYEDGLTEARVHEFCRNLAAFVGNGCEITKQMWLLSQLRIGGLRAIAAGEAAAADVVIVSLHFSEQLPAEVESWVKAWVESRHGCEGRALLAALFDPSRMGLSSSIRSFLKETAKRGRMEFLVEAVEALEE